MNLRQLRLAQLLSENGSFSQTAELQGISQPALSKHILSLEKELGVQLFDRNHSPVVLTPAGEYLIREGKELLHREEMLTQAMKQFSSEEKGQLVIGITPFRSSYLIADVIRKVREKFPGVTVRLVEEGSEILRKEAAEGRFSFCVVNLPVDETLFDIIPIEEDRLAVVMSREMYESNKELMGKKEISFRECAELPFVVPAQNREMRRLFDRLCVSCEINPQIVCEVNNMTTAGEMALSGVAATMLPVQYVEKSSYKDSLSVIEIKDKVDMRRPAVVFRKGTYIPSYVHYAVSLLTDGE